MTAVVNILNEGERTIGSRRPEFKPVENPPVDDRRSMTGLRSGGSTKQEAETEENHSFSQVFVYGKANKKFMQKYNIKKIVY